jgi:rhodanese-related sulfurtransferase
MNKKQITNILYWSVIAGMVAYFSYYKGWILSDFETITPKQAYTILQNNKNITLLDVRTPDEYAQEHIDGAVLIPLQVLNENLNQLQSVKGKKMIVYCHSGNRSVAASRILAKNGFIPLNVKGGITQWKSDGYSVVH